MEHNRSRSGARSDDERLDVEATDELGASPPRRIGLDVALIPGQSERRVRHLDHEQVEVLPRRQSVHLHPHDLERAVRGDRDLAAGVRAGSRRSRRRSTGPAETGSEDSPPNPSRPVSRPRPPRRASRRGPGRPACGTCGCDAIAHPSFPSHDRSRWDRRSMFAWAVRPGGPRCDAPDTRARCRGSEARRLSGRRRACHGVPLRSGLFHPERSRGTLVPRAPPTRPRRPAAVRAGQARGGGAARAGARPDRQAGLERGPVRPVPGGARGDRAAGSRASTATPSWAASCVGAAGRAPRRRARPDRGRKRRRRDRRPRCRWPTSTPATRSVMGWPSFISYRLDGDQAGGDAGPRCRCATARYDLDAMAERHRAAHAASSTSATPTTPPARWSAASELAGVPRPRAPSDVLVVVDEAYHEYVDRPRLPGRDRRARARAAERRRRCARSRRSTAWPGCGSATLVGPAARRARGR